VEEKALRQLAITKDASTTHTRALQAAAAGGAHHVVHDAVGGAGAVVLAVLASAEDLSGKSGKEREA
jgi:hypothetical protein